MDEKTEQKLYDAIEKEVEKVRDHSIVRGGQLVALNVIDTIDNSELSDTNKLKRIRSMCTVILEHASAMKMINNNS